MSRFEGLINTPEHVRSFASMSHNQWRVSRKRVPGMAPDGLPKREERWKPVDPKDPAGPKVDIANTPYEQLPPAWQNENRLAAETALADEEALAGPHGFVDLEEAAARTHVAWKGRNPWATGEQAGSYADLSPGEKQKDRRIIEDSAAVVNADGIDIRLTNKTWERLEQLTQQIQDAEANLATAPDREAAEQAIDQLQTELRQLRFAIHEEEPYAAYDPRREGTEGARPDLTLHPGEEDRYGYRDSETREEKLERQKGQPSE